MELENNSAQPDNNYVEPEHTPARLEHTPVGLERTACEARTHPVDLEHTPSEPRKQSLLRWGNPLWSVLSQREYMSRRTNSFSGERTAFPENNLFPGVRGV